MDAAVGVQPSRPSSAPAGPPTPAPEAPGRPDRPEVSLPYVPGLDGLRAVGLVVMLAYHHGISGARGGIFAVSMFFTLSGYLITTLALREWGHTGRLSLARFWERRVRRLLPAALLTVGGVVALQAFAGVGSSPRFTGDVLGALGYAANWRLALSGGDYASTFTLGAPVQHFWSLAIEEQFYLAFPLLLVGLLALTRGRWRLVGATVALGAAASFAAAWWSAERHGNSGITYYATYTRAGEILVGVALAFGLVTGPGRRLLGSRAGSRAVRALGIGALAGLLALWHTVGLADAVVFRGATALNAALTALAIVACVSPRPGAAARVLGLGPLRALGRISYGAYLFHWPLFLLLDRERTGLAHWPLFAVRVGATVALAALSYHLLEARFRPGGADRRRSAAGAPAGSPGPARRAVGSTRPRLAAVLGVPAGALVVLVLVVPVHTPRTVDLRANGHGPAFPDVVVPVGGRPPAARVLLLGDSVTWSLYGGFRTWNRAHAEQFHVDNYRAIGCPVAGAGTLRFSGDVRVPGRDCQRFRELLPAMLDRADYDAVVVVMGHADLAERRLGGRWRHVGQPAFDRWFEREVAELADVLAHEGAPVLWASTPDVRALRGDGQPRRTDRLNELVAGVVDERSGFRLLDVAGWLRGVGGEDDARYRADGAHYTVLGADELAAWMAPQLLSVARDR